MSRTDKESLNLLTFCYEPPDMPLCLLPEMDEKDHSRFAAVLGISSTIQEEG
jgi:hypothetical protein